MVDLFSYPDAPPTAAQRTRADAIAAARTVRLSPELRAAGARSSGKSQASEFPEVATQLTAPLAVSGLDKRGLDRLQRFIEPHRPGACSAMIRSPHLVAI